MISKELREGYIVGLQLLVIIAIIVGLIAIAYKNLPEAEKQKDPWTGYLELRVKSLEAQNEMLYTHIAIIASMPREGLTEEERLERAKEIANDISSYPSISEDESEEFVSFEETNRILDSMIREVPYIESEDRPELKTGWTFPEFYVDVDSLFFGNKPDSMCRENALFVQEFWHVGRGRKDVWGEWVATPPDSTIVSEYRR